MSYSSKAYAAAVDQLLSEFQWNPWFLNSYWPENEPRIRLMTRLAKSEISELIIPDALEVGCANGYVAFLFSALGFRVRAVDAYDDSKRTELFEKGRITYSQTNLNDAVPLSEFGAASFDLVLLGEVFEHILNHPAGLLKSIHRILRPGGLLILSTPNPSSLANAARVLRDTYQPWGTREFLTEVKMNDGSIIDRGDIHYREYPAHTVRALLSEIGFVIESTTYVRSGNAPGHSIGKRGAKRIFSLLGLDKRRLLAPGYVISARPLAGQSDT